jgi:hypothetical protein
VHVVGVDLVPGEEQLLRPVVRVRVGGDEDVVERGECVTASAMWLAARAVDEPYVGQPLGGRTNPGR